MRIDAVILMGGRAERLGGGVKGDLRVEGRTLLERVVAAAVAAAAHSIVVVGEAGRSILPGEVVVVREEPPFSGPAAAIAAGVRAFADTSQPTDASAVLLLAGDLPFVADGIPPLIAGLESASATEFDGVRAIDDEGRAQHLLALVRRPALVAAIDALAATVPIEGASMRRLLDPLRLADIPVPAPATMDVDTWADADAIGATEGTGHEHL